MSGSTRVFVRLFDGDKRRETDDEVVALPPAPLTWPAVIAAMAAAVGMEPDVGRARLFLLPAEADGIAAELNARALRFGVRENDRFVLCLNGEDYQQPKASDSAAAKAEVPSSAAFAPAPIGTAPGGAISGAGPPAGSMGLSSGKKGNKRYRSISGKMAAIKSLGDKGLISNEDRGHLKDLLLNNDSPQLQEALDKYNSTGDFHAVKELLVKELQNPSAKRNAGDWLSESLVNDIALSFNTSDTPTSQNGADAASSGFEAAVMSGNGAALASSTAFSYQTSTQVTAAQVGQSTSGYPHSAPMNMSYASNGPTAPTMSPSSGAHISPTVARPPMLTTPRGFVPASQPTIIPDPFNHPQLSPTNVYSTGAPQINMPLRDRNGFMKRAYEASPVNSMTGMMVPVGASPAVSNMSYGMPPQQQYGMSQGYSGMAPGYASGSMGQSAYSQPIGASGMYSMGGMGGMGGMYNPYQQHGYQTVPTGYPYGTLMPDGLTVPGYDFYSAGYGYGKAQLRDGGKWTTTPPMPSYPPPCSKEEKKEKIARWLKKRENRNWSNKPSYPVRHSIAKARKRGEDGRFITKARLAEMAKEEEEAAAAATAGGEHLQSSGSNSLGLDHQGVSMSSAMPQPTPVV